MKFSFNKKQIVIIISIFALLFAGLYLFLSRAVQPTVINTSPDNGSSDVSETSQISINFDASIQEKSKTKIFVALKPQADFDSTWLANTYKIIPKTNLQNNQKYTVNVLFDNTKIYSFSFETEIFNSAVIQKYGSLQSQNDFVFGQVTKDLITKYPWYTSLPVKTNNYIVDYDFDKQEFVITFLVPIESSDQLNTLTSDVMQKLKGIGVKDPITYYMNMIAPRPSPNPGL
jgi:hypothetical protein